MRIGLATINGVVCVIDSTTSKVVENMTAFEFEDFTDIHPIWMYEEDKAMGKPPDHHVRGVFDGVLKLECRLCADDCKHVEKNI